MRELTIGIRSTVRLNHHEVDLIVRANNKGTVLYKVQKKFQKIFGFTLPLFYGRG